MAYVSNEIKNLVLAMSSNTKFFVNTVLPTYSKAEINALISQIKNELASQLMDEDDQDALYILQLTLENA